MSEEPTPNIFKTQDDIDAIRFGDDVDLRNATFKCFADFSEKRFKGKVDFTGAVFEDGASFKNAKFLTQGQDVLFDEAVFLSPKNDVTFENAQFGLPYQREFGEWQIGFKRTVYGYSLLRRKNERPPGKFEDLGNIPEGDEKSFFTTKGIDVYRFDICQSRKKYKNNPGNVSFKGCRFENGGIVSFTFVGFNNSGSVNFTSVRFTNDEGVYFGSAHFTNDEGVYFGSTYFTNDGEVSFKSSKFTHNASVNFDLVRFANRGDVSFYSAGFENSGYVSFESSRFFNRGNVIFSFARFANGGQVWLLYAGFFNGRHVYFDSAKFINGGSLNFRQIIWANSGSLLWWKQVEFKETAAVKFDECLFLSKEAISFGEIWFPKNGSVMFQRCYFARTPIIDFTGAVFRHTTFEGGKISWLEDQPDRILTAVLKNRLKEKFDDLPQEAKDRIDKLNMKIPIISRVFKQDLEVRWKDLTAESAKNLTFRSTNLSGSIFDGMTLSHVQLNAPKWAVVQGRKGLYEEKQWRDKGFEISVDQLINIGDQYTQLKNKIEGQGNYLEAGDFYYGEQEIRREILIKDGDWLKKINNFPLYFLTTLYKWFSGYGERPKKSILVTLAMILFFSMALTAIKIDYVNQWPFVSQAIIESNYLTEPLKLWKMLKVNSPEYFQMMAQLITPFSWRTRFGANGEWMFYQYFLIPGQIVLLGIQLPLMILAIRRRFKR